MFLINSILWAFAAMLFSVPVMWLYAVAWIVWSIWKGE